MRHIWIKKKILPSRKNQNVLLCFCRFYAILEFWGSSCTKVCKYDQVDLIFDSYNESSIKEGERQRRSAVGAPLQFVRLEETTPIPVQIERFWSCSKNKERLQILANFYFERKAFGAEHKTVLSGIVSDTDGVISGQEIFRQKVLLEKTCRCGWRKLKFE